MTINHLDLQTSDLVATRDFFVNFCDFKLISSPTSKAIAILKNADFTLVIQASANAVYPENFHVGFYVNSQEEVSSCREAMSSGGLAPGELISNNRGFMYYVKAPGGILVEVNCPASRP